MENEQEAIDGRVEVMAPGTLAAMNQSEIMAQVSTAHAYPRSLELFKKRAISMATIDEDVAESCLYYRPVGKEKNAKGEWVMKHAEGMSIRMAEIVGAAYGNIRVQARIVEMTDRYVKAQGQAIDLESNYAGSADVIESTVNKEGQPYSERQRALIAKVAVSKAYRDATFRVVPKSLCKPIEIAVRKILGGGAKTLEERRKKMMVWVTSLRVDPKRVFQAIGVQGEGDINLEKLELLIGIHNAIQDGDSTIDEAFPVIVEERKPALFGKGKPAPAPKPEPSDLDGHAN